MKKKVFREKHKGLIESLIADDNTPLVEYIDEKLKELEPKKEKKVKKYDRNTDSKWA